MANRVVPGTNQSSGVLQPINGNASQMGGRSVVHLQTLAAPQVLLQVIDQARTDQNLLQNRLERQVQQGEVALFQIAQRNTNLVQQLNQSVNLANEQRGRANGLEAQLVVERQEKANLTLLLRQLQDQEHVLRGEAENAVRLKDDIQRRLEASDARIRAFEQQVINERAEARRRDRLKDLQVSKAELEQQIESVANPQITVVITSSIGGQLRIRIIEHVKKNLSWFIRDHLRKRKKSYAKT